MTLMFSSYDFLKSIKEEKDIVLYWQDEQRSFELRKAVDNIKNCR